MTRRRARSTPPADWIEHREARVNGRLRRTETALAEEHRAKRAALRQGAA